MIDAATMKKRRADIFACYLMQGMTSDTIQVPQLMIEAVAELKLKGLSREEIRDLLREVWNEVYE